MRAYFLQQKNFTSKKGTECHMLVACDSDGNVLNLFHDGSISVGCALFAPLELSFDMQPFGRGVKSVLISAKEVK